jgi:hypothetical protein
VFNERFVLVSKSLTQAIFFNFVDLSSRGEDDFIGEYAEDVKNDDDDDRIIHNKPKTQKKN